MPRGVRREPSAAPIRTEHRPGDGSDRTPCDSETREDRSPNRTCGTRYGTMMREASFSALG
jgi:hypothetical protein